MLVELGRLIAFGNAGIQLGIGLKLVDWRQFKRLAPFIDGIEICGRVKRISRLKATPVIILTAHTDEDSRKRALAAGADAFVNKPLAGKNLRQTIADMLEKREMQLMKQTHVTLED